METSFKIPAKSYNEMKGKMEDSNLPEWQKYYKDLQAWEEKMDVEKPSNENSLEYSDWQMKRSCDAPNPPGYYRANND